jgi:protein gp37
MNARIKFHVFIFLISHLAKVPFYFKQWGGVQKKRAGRTLEGRTWDEMPVNVGLVKV